MRTLIPLELIPQDFRRGKRGNPRACLLERGLERVYGGKWTVGADARQRGVMWPRIWALEDDSERAMDLFDSKAPVSEIFEGRQTLRVHLRGKPPRAMRRQRSRGPSRQRKAPAVRKPVRSLSRWLAPDEYPELAPDEYPEPDPDRYPEPAPDRYPEHEPDPVHARSRWPGSGCDPPAGPWAEPGPGPYPYPVPEPAPPVVVPGTREPATPAWPDSPAMSPQRSLEH